MTRAFGVNGSDFLVSVDLMEASGALEKQVNVYVLQGKKEKIF